MRRKVDLFLLICFTNILAPSVMAQQWKVSPVSSIAFEVENLKLNTVKGSLEMPTATFELDVNAIDKAQFDVKVNTSSIRTGVKKRDEHMLEEAFFHAEQHPNIIFKSISITPSETENKFVMRGLLKIKSFENPIEFPFVVDNSQGTPTLIGEFTIDRKDYGLGLNYSSFIIGEEVKIKLKIVLEKK